MNNSTRMNVFLQRMLRKSDEELNVDTEDKNEINISPGKGGSPKAGWIKKLGSYSPSKYKVPSSPLRSSTTMRSLDTGLSNSYVLGSPKNSSNTSHTPLEMPDLESIIREFEKGFLSPTKHDAPAASSKQKNFVKKIVAAFEVKYKTYNDLKAEHEAKEFEEENRSQLKSDESRLSFTNLTNSPKRRSGIFSSPFRSHTDELKNGERKSATPETLGKFDQSSFKSEPRWKSALFSSPSNNSSETKSPRKSGIFSPFGRNSSKEISNSSQIQMSPIDDSNVAINKSSKSPINGSIKSSVNDLNKSLFNDIDKSLINSNKSLVNGSNKSLINSSKSPMTSLINHSINSPLNSSLLRPINSTMNSQLNNDPEKSQNLETTMETTSFMNLDREDSIFASTSSGFCLNPFALDDTKSMCSLDLDVTLPEANISIHSSPQALNETRILTSDLSEIPETPLRSRGIDRTPRIVGAFLKKPIEVEDTSIDWIPITGKKLPRKKSLKKLLSSLTGKKSYQKKGSALFSSERNLNEESRELQDSGYDERSCSSSSLASLISISEVLLHQENTYVEPERRSTLRTFRSQNSVDQEEEDEAFSETYCSRRGKKKLILTEVPRENLKLDLGPSFPSSSKILTMSLDRRAHCKVKTRTSPKYLPSIPKHPFSSTIPKHPFISMTKMDVVEESVDGEECPSVVVRNDLYEVEFRRSCDYLPVTGSARSSLSLESDYDVPRRFISKSETGIPEICARDLRKKKEDPVYDVPRPWNLQRPKSSVYEDALSLKRRTADFTMDYPRGFYSSSDSSEPHYATVKPRSKRIYLRGELPDYYGSFTSMEKVSSF